MSTLTVEVRMIEHDVISHPNADKLSLIQIDEYMCATKKSLEGEHVFQKGDYVVYVPEDSVIPADILKFYDFWNESQNKGVLDGTLGNRVKARLMRGLLSQGLILPLQENDGLLYLSTPDDTFEVFLGQNVADILGIVKYVPEIPQALLGSVIDLYGYTMHYDIENYQKHPYMFKENDEVVITEKIHGVNSQLGYIPGLNHPDLLPFGGDMFITSKGLGSQGLVFKENQDKEDNIYLKQLKLLIKAGLRDRLVAIAKEFGKDIKSIHLFFEIFGSGVQDLHYGLKDQVGIRIFDIAVNKQILDDDAFKDTLRLINLPNIMAVPELYRGAFKKDIVVQYRDGVDSISGTNIREGIIIKPVKEIKTRLGHRKILKWVSPAYLVRKNGTEFN